MQISSPLKVKTESSYFVVGNVMCETLYWTRKNYSLGQSAPECPFNHSTTKGKILCFNRESTASPLHQHAEQQITADRNTCMAVFAFLDDEICGQNIQLGVEQGTRGVGDAVVGPEYLCQLDAVTGHSTAVDCIFARWSTSFFTQLACITASHHCVTRYHFQLPSVWPSVFKVTVLFNVKWLQNGTYAYNSRKIVNRIWYWTTPKPDFKVTPLFDAEYLRNSTRYR